MNAQTREADRIYEALFKKEIPKDLRKRFLEAAHILETHYSRQEIDEYYGYLGKISDLEALELAARYFKRIPLLTDKFKIMVYLAETRPENYSHFISETDNVVKAYLWMPIIVVHSLGKFLKGLFLLKICKP